MPINLIFCFFISLFTLLFSEPFFPKLHLLFFAPSLALAILRLPLINLLYLSLFSGLVVDSFTSSTHFGMTGCAYALAVSLLFTRRYDLFEDNFSTLPIMTLLFSILSALSERILYFLFGTPLTFSAASLFADFFLLPLFNALYSLFLFLLPWYVYKKMGKLILKRRAAS